MPKTISDKKILFFVTSPRSPEDLRTAVEVLTAQFSGRPWNSETQEEFLASLVAGGGYRGNVAGDVELKGRERITRAARPLGFVKLDPIIQLTPAGQAYLNNRTTVETFRNQLLKFQLPSPFHPDPTGRFSVRPYLETLRLTSELQSLSRDEIALFVLQLRRIDAYDQVRDKILDFRTDAEVRGYQQAFVRHSAAELSAVYHHELATGNLRTRQTPTKTAGEFLAKKLRSWNDYANAMMRYLAATDLLVRRGTGARGTLSLVAGKEDTVQGYLTIAPRQPMDDGTYLDYLFDPTEPALPGN